MNRLPRWKRDSEEWRVFLEDIRANGIKVPLRITENGHVVDGETRRLAALALKLTEVPVVVIDEAEVAGTILRELTLRRNLTKGQIAYAAVPLLDPEWKRSNEANIANIRSGSPEALCGRFSEFASGRLGIGRNLLFEARALRNLLDEHGAKPFHPAGPDARENFLRLGFNPEVGTTWREYFEAAIYDSEKPMGIGAAVAGIGYLIRAEMDPRRRTGGAPKVRERQLELFTKVTVEEITRWAYWQRFDDDLRASHWEKVREAVRELPTDQCESMAEYHTKMAAELRKAARRQ